MIEMVSGSEKELVDPAMTTVAYAGNYQATGKNL